MGTYPIVTIEVGQDLSVIASRCFTPGADAKLFEALSDKSRAQSAWLNATDTLVKKATGWLGLCETESLYYVYVVVWKSPNDRWSIKANLVDEDVLELLSRTMPVLPKDAAGDADVNEAEDAKCYADGDEAAKDAKCDALQVMKRRMMDLTDALLGLGDVASALSKDFAKMSGKQEDGR